MIYDVNDSALARIQEYNIAFQPTCYVDGGHDLYVGGYAVLDSVLERMKDAGERAVPELGLITAIDRVDTNRVRVRARIGNGVSANEPLPVPTPVGPGSGLNGVSLAFKVALDDPNGDDLYYQFDVDGLPVSDWFGPYPSGDTCSYFLSWPDVGSYDVRVRARDVWDDTCAWSDPLTVMIYCCLNRGDLDHGGGTPAIDISDLVYLVDYMFTNGPAPECLEEGDVDASGGDPPIDISDLVYLVDFMFTNGPTPPDCPVY